MCSAQCIHTGLKMECLTGQEHKGRKPFLIRRKRACQGIFRGTETEIKFGEGAESSEAGMEIGAKTQTQSVNFNFWSRSCDFRDLTMRRPSPAHPSANVPFAVGEL